MAPLLNPAEPARPTVHPAVFDPARVAPEERARLAVLAAIASLDDLRRNYVLKGGLVLQHVYGSPRPSHDLDFNHVRSHPNTLTAAHEARLQSFCDRVAGALPRFAAPYALARLAVHVEKWSELLPTVFALVAWEDAESGTGTVELQATLCERVCRSVKARIGGVAVHTAALDDIVADKLKVLLQQTRRHEVRSTDVYDLWYALEAAPFVVDPSAVGPFLRQKAAAWPDLLPITAARFREAAVQTFAEAGYRRLHAEQPALLSPPFDAVWTSVLAFVDQLGLDKG